MRELFLDANAHVPISKPAIDALIQCNSSLAGHGHASSPSKPGRAAETAIEAARDEIAELLGADNANQIIFTSTCTQACEWGIEIFNHINENKNIYMSQAEHPAVRAKVHNSCKYSLIKSDENGVIDTSYPISQDSGAICIFVQNEIGSVQPIEKIKSNSLFSDMSQAPGKIEFPKLNDIKNLDIAVFGAHKFAGPGGVGFFYLKDTSYWREYGSGSRYFFDRPGTPDTCNIVATAAALKYSIFTLSHRAKQMKEFRDEIEPKLEDLGFTIIGKGVKRVPNTTFVRIPKGKHAQILMLNLGNLGIHVGLGSACGSVHAGTSPLMKILGRAGDVGNYLRISTFGEYGKEDGKYFIDCMNKVLNG